MYSLLVEQGLTRYYELARGNTAPAEPPRDRGRAWLEPLVALAEAPPEENGRTSPNGARGGDVCTLVVDVQGIHCAACVWLMNEMFRRLPGGVAITVNPALGKMRLAWHRGRFAVCDFIADVERFGYLFAPDRKRAAAASRDLPVRLGICAAVTINVMMFSVSFYLGLDRGALYTLFSRLTLALSAVVVLVGGQVFFRSALRALRRGVLHLDLPIATGILLSFAASFVQARAGRGDHAYFDTLNVFVTLMLLGRWLQERVIERNRRFLVEDDGIDGLFVRRREGSALALVPAPSVRAGDELVIAPGDLVPTDAALLDDSARISTDWISGESKERAVHRAELLAAGSFNAGRAAITVRASTSFQDSPLPRLLRKQSSEHESAGGAVPAHARFFDRYARIYVALVFILSAAGGLLWWRLDPARAVDVVVAILVVTCPCAVGLAAPLAVELVQAQLRRSGFFVRSGDLLERLARVRKVLFDKTGTLTLGRLALVGGDHPGALDPELRDAAFNLASRSNHPVSRCLAGELLRAGARFESGAVVEEHPGAGLERVEGGHRTRLGRPSWAREGAADSPCEKSDSPSGPGQPRASDAPGITLLTVDGRTVASFTTAEDVRPDARREIAALTERGYEVWLISGDVPERVSRFAAALGIAPDRALAGRRPDDKAADVARIDARDTLYLGDGVNDSLAFERAYCSGTTAIDRPVVPGRCDFFLLGEGIWPVGEALALARLLRRVLLSNLSIALAYNLLAVLACFLGLMTPLRAALAMPASSVLLLLATTARLSRKSRGRHHEIKPGTTPMNAAPQLQTQAAEQHWPEPAGAGQP